MLILISKIVFVLSFLGILFIIFRKVPALSRLPREPFIKKFSLKPVFALFGNSLGQVASSNFFQKNIVGGLEKSLRRFKILALKLDNLLDKFIRMIKRKSRKN